RGPLLPAARGRRRGAQRGDPGRIPGPALGRGLGADQRRPRLDARGVVRAAWPERGREPVDAEGGRRALRPASHPAEGLGGRARGAAEPTGDPRGGGLGPLAPPAPADRRSYAAHTKPSFRESARGSMRFALDLWHVGDVRSNAEAILDRLQEGSMPCDGGWPPDRVDLFRRWVAGGEGD